jgi:predicted nuclease of predicted toxin-antitoxin system
MIGFYLDEHFSRSIATALNQHGYFAIIAFDAGMNGKTDPENLAYATEHELVMVTFDHKFAGQMMSESNFLALVCLTLDNQNDIGAILHELTIFAELYEPERDSGKVHWLP